MRISALTVLSFLILIPHVTLAEIKVSSDSDLFQEVQSAGYGETLVLQGQKYPQSIEVIGNTLTLQGAASGTEIGGSKGNSMLYLDKASDVTLKDINFVFDDPERAGIFVDGGKLRMSSGSISGNLRFAIYATSGASIFVDGVEFTGMKNGIYLLDQGDIVANDVRFMNLSGPSISGFGSQIAADLENVHVTTAPGVDGVSPIVFREGAKVTIRHSMLLGPNANGIYVDDGAHLTVDDLIIDGAALGVLALNSGPVSISDSTVEGFTSQGVAIDGASDLTLKSVQIDGSGQAVGLRGAIKSILVDSTVLSNSNPEIATLFVNTGGSFMIANTSASGGYAALYVQGVGAGTRVIEGSDFSNSAFAAAVLQEASPLEGESPIYIEGSFFVGEGTAVGLAMDSTSSLKINNSAVIGVENAAFSIYNGAKIDASKTIVGTGISDPWLGESSHTFENLSRANVVRGDLDFTSQSVIEVFRSLSVLRDMAVQKATQAGQVVAVNKEGLKLFGDAAKIELISEDGTISWLSNQSVPLDMPAGRYQLRIDGAPISSIDVEPARTTEIEIPEPVHPYFLYQNDKEYTRGASLPLLSRDVIRRNYKARGLIGDAYTFWNRHIYGPLRADLTADERAKMLAQARVYFFDNFLLAHQASLKGENLPEGFVAKGVFNYSAGVLAALGTADDRDQILALMPPIPTFQRTTAVEVATLIEARLGLLDESAVFAQAQKILSTKPILSIELATFVGALGHKSASGLILEAIEQPNYDANELNFSFRQLTFALLARSNDARVLTMFRKVLSNYRSAVAALPTGTQMVYSNEDGFGYYMLPIVMEYLAVFGNQQDWQNLSIPIAGFFTLDTSIVALLQDPLPVYLDHIGMAPRPVAAYVHYSQIPGYGHLICRSLERRPKATRDNFINSLIQTTGSQINRNFYQEDENRTWVVGEAVTQVTSSYCNPNDRVAEAFRRRPHDLEILPYASPALSWGTRRVVADLAIEKFTPENNGSDMRLFSNISRADLAAATANDPRFATEPGRALLLHHSAIDLRYQEAIPDIYPSATLRRVFVTGIAASGDSAVLAGRVDLRPIIQNGRLLAGLRLRVAYDEDNGLAATIARRDVLMAEALENGAFKFIKAVRMRIGDTIVPMKFEQSAAGNVHVYAVDLPETGLDNLVIDVDLEVLEEKWKLHFPLYASDFAYRFRLGE